MTNDQLGAFVDWMKSQRHADFAVWTYPAADGWRARFQVREQLPKVTDGATPREAIAALAAQVMPKPQCCRICTHWRSHCAGAASNSGDCVLPPSSDAYTGRVYMLSHQGTRCPGFQRRPE
jgi:hypothetical protein